MDAHLSAVASLVRAASFWPMSRLYRQNQKTTRNLRRWP